MIRALRSAKAVLRLSDEDFETLSGYSIEDEVNDWIDGKKPVTLVQACDWAETLGFELTLVRRK